jgi:UDP-2,3-diacylglucosamine pyrophosphatase LpxH
MTLINRVVLSRSCLLALALIAEETGIQDAVSAEQQSYRPIYVISDLHFGVGKTDDGEWDPHEDFRWPNALQGFLNEIRRRSADSADLVIAGDLLELWQPPRSIPCRNGGNRGCSVAEVKRLVTWVADAHQKELASLSAFASAADNRLYVVPGNHDAAILVPEVWKILEARMGGANNHIVFVKEGIWSSPDGSIVIEHGHQIGADVNGFKEWPQVTVAKSGVTYLQSPWGERFVQRLFNEEEAHYPIIDNLIPESAGARMRLSDRGLWKSVQDVARFLEFNLVETTWGQKGQALGGDNTATVATACDAKALGYKLLLDALPTDDPFRVAAEDDSPESEALRRELSARARELPEDEVKQLCGDMRTNGHLGAAVQGTLVRRETVMRAHLEKRLQTFPKMQTFVYAHTHQIESPWPVKVSVIHSITVANDGAFQRLVGPPGYQKRTAFLGIKASEGLSRIPLEALAPCYGFVSIPADGDRSPTSQMWRMDEAATTGQILEVGDPSCE